MQIPEFQRRRLASSVVGTAGIDTSGTQLANTIAQGAGSIADTALSLAVKRQEAKDRAVAFDTTLTYEGEMAKMSLENRQRYAGFDGDPTVPAEDLRTRGAALRDSMAASLGSDGARLDFLEKSGTHLNSAFKQELDAANRNQVAVAAERVVSSNNKITNTAYGLFKNPEVDYRNKLATLNGLDARRVENVRNSGPILGVEEATKLDKSSREGLMKAAVSGLMENNPIEAMKFLKEKGVADAMGADAHAEWVDRAQKAAANFKEIVRQRQFAAAAQTNSQDIQDFYDGKHDLASIQAIKDDKTRKLLTDAYLDTKQLTPGEIFDVQADYVNQYENLFVRDKKTGVLTSELKKDTKYEDVVKLQQIAMANFKITQSNSSLVALSKKLPDLIAGAVDNGQPNALMRAFTSAMNTFTPVAKAIAMGRIPDLSKLDHTTAGEKAEMANEFFTKLSNVNVEDPVAVQNAIKSTVEAHQSKKNPNRARYLIGEVVQTPRGAGEVIGYRNDGEPLLRFKK